MIAFDGDDWLAELRALLAGEPDAIANAANTTALIMARVSRLNWVGFYFRQHDTLVLGPFQGQPACTRIPIGKGVCGAAAERNETIVVDDVHQFPGHIVCDTASLSEIVVPVSVPGRLEGVLDIDSPERARFTASDRAMIEAAAAIFVEACTAT